MYLRRLGKYILAISILILSLAGCSDDGALGMLEDGDIVIKFKREGYEILSVAQRDGRKQISSKMIATTVPGDYYKCDNDPPQDGDSCSCGGHTGVGSGVLNIIDCGLLKIDCKDNNFDENSNTCSHWDGDPLPPRP
jgi:hypothetical protein